MSNFVKNKNLMVEREQRAMSIATLGLVNREGAKFMVSTPSLPGKQTMFEVYRDDAGQIRCNCLEYANAAQEAPGFRCEHILAVKFALFQKNSEAVTKQKVVSLRLNERSKSEFSEQ